MPTLSLSEKEETTVRSTLSERDDQEFEEQRQQSSITSKAILRIFLNNDSTPTQSQVNNTSPNQLENDEPEETPTAHLTTTTPPSSSLRPEVDESRDDDGYSNTAYLENISAALGRNGPLQQSTLSPTTDSSRCSSPSSVSDAVLQTDDRRGRKKKDRRRKAFEKLVRHLENGAEEDDEENFGDGRPRSCSSVRLKSVIRREYLPEHVRSHGAGNGCPGTSGSYVLPSSYHYHYHRPSSSYSSRYCCYCCAWKNCGNCALLKVFVGVTMLVAILLCLAERCSAPVDGKIRSTTLQPANLSTTAAEAFYNNATTSTSSPIIVIGGNWTGNWSTLANESTIKNESAAPASNIVHCVFRDFYIVLLSLGLLVFFSIFLAYTCKLVVHYHHFPWFLTESIAVGLFSVLLFVASIIGLLLKRQTASSTLGLIDALLGFIIAFSAYLSHFNGLMPIMNISVDDDPDCNQLNRILGEKQFSRIVRGL